MKDPFNAFVDETIVKEPLSDGRLSSLTFSVKDVFHLKGVKNSAGNPDWLRTHGPSEETAPSVTQLLHQGAKLIGTTLTDELMYSLQGENVHYGTPINPRDKSRIPGGSSSGSAVVVAAGLRDFALGTDTGGSVRIPAAYCGLFGFRPTHGSVSIDHVIPLASSFDTVGWMTRDAKLLESVGETLLNNVNPVTTFTRKLISYDAWKLADSDTQAILSPYVQWLKSQSDEVIWQDISVNGLSAWSNTFRIIQASEIWQAHGKWIELEEPEFGSGIKERFETASKITADELVPELEARKLVRKHLTDLLEEDGLLIIPTVPGIAPLRDLPDEEVEERRKRTLQLSCIAGLAGLPQVTIPVTSKSGAPVGLSIIAGPNQDLSLLKWVNDFVASYNRGD
ncbi:amidase [Salipaludibacillus sp. HK11]|uniref:amidase n=1 Tax=Salipaludibacillus sp. HK11 TaxID=3394320 RepID=UPI0039FD81CF